MKGVSLRLCFIVLRCSALEGKLRIVTRLLREVLGSREAAFIVTRLQSSSRGNIDYQKAVCAVQRLRKILRDCAQSV